jgi:hypothetical protein
MKLFVVLNHNGTVQAVCERPENAEAKIPLQKRHKKVQAADRSWTYGYSEPWTIRHIEVAGERPVGLKTRFVYVTEEPLSLNYVKDEGRKEIRVLDENGLFVEEAK